MPRVSPRVMPSRVNRNRAWFGRAFLGLFVAAAVLLGATGSASAAERPAKTVPPGKTAKPAPAGKADPAAVNPPLMAILNAVNELTERLNTRPLTAVEQLKAAKQQSELPGVSGWNGAGRSTNGAGDTSGTKECRDAGKGNVPKLVAAIFRCHLRAEGFNEQEVSQFTAEALVVSKCESKWDANIVVFNGKYLDSAHPRTGYRYSAAGVFQFIRKTADKWIDGGYANVKKARYNIDAAARLFIHNRQSGYLGWEDWACAAANDGFKNGSVLPNWPGGPSEMPAWSWRW